MGALFFCLVFNSFIIHTSNVSYLFLLFYTYNQWMFFLIFTDLWKWKLCNSTRTFLYYIFLQCCCFFFFFWTLLLYKLGIRVSSKTVIKYKHMFYFLFGLMENVWRCHGGSGENFFFFFPYLFHPIFLCNFLLCACAFWHCLKNVLGSAKNENKKVIVRLS